MHDLTRSLRLGPESLRRWFPERFRRLVEVYAERSARARRERLARRLLAVCAVVFDLAKAGECPALHRASVYPGLPSTFSTERRVPLVWRKAFAACGFPPLPHGSRNLPRS